MMALETYFRGVLLVPERELFLARLNGLVVGSAHLVRPPRNNEAQAHAAQLMHAYIAPYARGHGLARMLTIEVEERARELGYHVLNLDVRETQEAAIRLYESLGFERWGVHPDYAFVRGQVVRGFFYCKRLRRKPNGAAEGSRIRAAGNDGAHPLSRDRPEGRPVRPAASRRDGRGDGLFVAIRRAGARLAGRRLHLAARGRPERRLRRQAGERAPRSPPSSAP